MVNPHFFADESEEHLEKNEEKCKNTVAVSKRIRCR